MNIDITLNEAYSRASNRLKKKMEHSVDLLRKAERLALTYDPDEGYYLAFSGGKDSQALYHIAQLAGVRFRGHMNFTSVDPPQVIRFVRQHYPDVVKHSPEKSIYQLATERGILPSMRVRWCCADLKESAGAGKVTLIGIRKAESARRAKRKEVEVSNRQFSGNLDEFAEWQKEQISKKEAKLISKMKREGKKVNEDEFSLQKDNEVRCINGKDSILVSPIFEWTERDVWEFLNKVVCVPHCELYDKGYRRIGCICCPMSSPAQKLREIKDFPHVKAGWIRAIKAIRRGGVQNGTCNATTMSDRQWKYHDKPPLLASQDQHRDLGWICHPDGSHWAGFSNSPSLNGNRGGQNEPSEDDIAENIFEWWISGKAYNKWYAEKFLQLHLDFEY